MLCNPTHSFMHPDRILFKSIETRVIGYIARIFFTEIRAFETAVRLIGGSDNHINSGSRGCRYSMTVKVIIKNTY